MNGDGSPDQELTGPGPVGRVLRFVLGLVLVVVTISVFLEAPGDFVLRTLLAVVLLLGFYSLLNYLVVTRLLTLGKWPGAILANGTALVVFLIGGAGGLIFGRGEGQAAVLLYVGLALLLAALRADPGCEVMSPPGLLFRAQAHFMCILFCPIDWLEARFPRSR